MIVTDGAASRQPATFCRGSKWALFIPLSATLLCSVGSSVGLQQKIYSFEPHWWPPFIRMRGEITPSSTVCRSLYTKGMRTANTLVSLCLR